MARTPQVALTSALTWAILAPGAFADLTAAEVWGDWRDYLQGLGYEITATEKVSGNELAVSDIRVGIAMPDDQGTVTMSVGSLTFVDAGDGTVDIIMPDVMPMAVEVVPNSDEKPSAFNLSYTQSGQMLKASGDPQNLSYDYKADSFGFSLDQMIVDGQTFGPDRARLNMSANNLASLTRTTVGETRRYDQTMTADGLQYDVFFNSPDGPETFSIKGQLNSLGFAGTSDVPMGMAMMDANMGALLKAGFGVDGKFTFGAGAYNMNVVDPSGNADIAGASDGAELAVKMGVDGLAYQGEQTNVRIDMQVPDLPFPISLAMAQSGFKLEMPLQKSEAAQDFALAFNMTDFTMSDMIWGMIDPSGQLPRDPATIALDVNGKAKVMHDMLDPKAAEQMATSGATPGELEAVTINQVLVEAAGAKLAGEGDFTFDNSDKTTLPGVPKPVGALNLSINGANGLIDRLVAMGLLPEEQAMGARMMMGMLAVPGAEPDSLTSKIEMTADGQILANGQRIK